MSPHVYEPTAEANAPVEEIRRAVATIDHRLEWLQRYVDEAEELRAQRAKLVERERTLLKAR